MWHRIKHWFGWEPCMNYTEWRGDRLWHYVICLECGERVIEFEAN